MKRNFLIISVVLFFSFTGFTLQNDKKLVTAGQLMHWVEYLASDEMKGRANGSPELQQASDWIASRFMETGLKHFNSIGGFMQEYEYTYQKDVIKNRNVIGYIEGSDPFLKNEFIIISAHYDHIGTSDMNYPDSVFNGADDNASGTATMLGIAENIMNSGEKPGRSIIFAAFSGEEHGMRGSRFFIKHAPVKINNIYANLNFEMTGHSEFLGPGRFYMTGCKNSNLDDVIIEYTGNRNFVLIDSIAVTDFLFNSSDNISFSRISANDALSEGIPSGTFATTAISEYLHTPGDEADLFDYNNMSQLTGYFSDVVIMLSNSRKEIEWTNPQFRRPQ